MKTSVPLYPPLNELKTIGENLWVADGPIIHMAMGPFRVPFSTRMAIVRLADGGLWCHSPLAPAGELFRAIDQLGPVRHLISPNYIHYAHIAAWKERYPQAVAWASPGVRERAAAQRIAVHFDRDLGDAAPVEWAAALDQHIFQGSKVMREVVFFHKASKTLILTDLIENFETEKMGWFWRLMMKLAGNTHPDSKAPIDMRATFTDRAAARASYGKIHGWRPEKILLAHGRCYLANGTAELERAFRWLG